MNSHNKTHKWTRIGLSIGLLALICVIWQGTPATSQPNAPYNNGRFGFGLTGTGGAPSNYDVEMLNGGVYWDWSAKGQSAIPGYEYMQTVRLQPKKSGSTQIGYTASPTGTRLLNAIAAQPGAIWLIGNEPDCVNMDNMRSEWYARAYHDMYYLIKQADPTAQIGAGSIVQPTPQRLMYLDRVLAAYQAAYNEPLPTDLWVIHNYTLCENCYPTQVPGEPFPWGACWVPDWPSYGASKSIATFYSVYDHWDMDFFTARLVTMRQWMYDNGYRNHPLIITEYGVLFYPGLVSGKTTQDDIDFMNAGFDWMRTARDPILGYAPDDDRLVQRWIWFSLDHDDWYLGGALFDHQTHQPLALGTAFGQYTAQLTPTVALRLLDAGVVGEVNASGPAVMTTLAVTVANAGNIDLQIPLTVTFFDKADPAHPIASPQINELRCCGGAVSVTALWLNQAGDAEFCVNLADATEILTTTCANLNIELQLVKVWADVPPSSGGPVTATLYATVRNEGNTSTGEVVTVTFSADAQQHSGTITPLGCCGAQATAAVQWPNYQPGVTYNVELATSYYTVTVPITVEFTSKLVISDVWAPTVYAQSPATATLYATVSNRGNLNISEPITLSFDIDSTTTVVLPLSTTIRALAAGDVVTSMVVGPAADGYYKFCAHAATSSTESESVCATLWVNPRHLYMPFVLRQ